MILIIKNCSELSYIENDHPELLGKGRILTTYPEVWLMLTSRGYSPMMTTDFLTADDYRQIKERARWLAHNWYSPVKGSLEYRGINLGELCRIDNCVFFYEAVMANMVMERIFKEEDPDEIALFDDPNVPCLWRNRYNGAHSIFNAVAIKTAGGKGVKVSRLRIPQPQKARLLRMACTLMTIGRVRMRKLSRKLSAAFSKRGLSLSPTTASAGKFSVITMADTYDAYIVWPVLRELAASGKFQSNIISTSTKTPIRNRSGLDYNVKIPHIPLNYFLADTEPEDKEAWSQVIACREELVHSLSTYIKTLGAPLDSYLPKVQYDYWWKAYFPSAMRRIDAVCKILGELKPDAVIIEDMASHPSRSLAQIARHQGIKSIGIPHGCINDIDEYDFDSDIFLAWGEMGKRQILRHFHKPEKSIEIAGSMVMENVAKTLAQSKKAGTPQKKKILGLRADSRVILIITVCFSWHLYGPLDIKEYLAAWHEIRDYASRHPEVDFVIKASPTEDYRLWYERFIQAGASKNVHIASDIQIEALMPFTDEVVLFQVISTAGIVAMLAEKPLLFFNNAVKPWHDYPQDDWNDRNGLAVVSRSTDIPVFLDRLNSDTEYRRSIIEGEKRFLDSYLYRPDGSTGERFVTIFEKTLSDRGY